MGDIKFIETFGSSFGANPGKSYTDGNTNSWYVMEMAEKKGVMSRAVLKPYAGPLLFWGPIQVALQKMKANRSKKSNN